MSESQLVGMMHELGFSAVHEVAFGADLVAREFSKLLAHNSDQRYIASPCPAVVAFVVCDVPFVVAPMMPSFGIQLSLVQVRGMKMKPRT